MEKLEAAVMFCKQHGVTAEFHTQQVAVVYNTGLLVVEATGHDLVAAVVALRTKMEERGVA